MNQFLPLVGQESKKVEDGCAAPASRLDFTDPSVQKQTSQIQFLLDRVYIIEDDWEKLQETLSKISKQMRGTIRDSETNLQIAIEKARRLMDSVGTNHRLTNEAHASTEMILDCGFFLKKNLADDNPSSEQGSRSVMSNNNGFADQSTNSCEKSDSTYSTSHQSSDQLESFPSYDGISNGE
ncbi:hypothetical protein C7M84_015902 [Penaeus vannamei]|uniref:Uncharacterized protein n=1 Tax=Penaeus vannamei TaxID=6689 RepID=A0A423SPP1_PENVA|nr:hypothetical protein C7M84_015902 [Penaeus vannamei]